MHLKVNRTFYLILFLLITIRSESQNLTQSPYSVIGIGEKQFQGNAQLSAMGQVSQGIRSGNIINNQNPASYSAFDYTQFEAGLLYAQGSISNAASSSQTDHFSFSYFTLGIPIYKKWGLSTVMGLQPYSGMGYTISLKSIYPLPATEKMLGRGGITRFYAGMGIRVYKGLSVGMNYSYLLGQMIQTQQLIVDPTTNHYSLENSSKTAVSDDQLQFGTQYEHTFLDEKYSWVTGVSVTLPTSLAATRDYTFRTMTADAITTVDTIASVIDQRGIIEIPMVWQAGMVLRKKDKWAVALDVQQTLWENYRAFQVSDSLINSTGVHAGFSFVPDATDYTRFFNRIEYRMGARYNTGYLQFNNTGISEYGFSAGMGIPLGKSRSRINLTAEYYSRGTTESGLLREDFFRFTLGINMVDRWFNRYKYD